MAMATRRLINGPAQFLLGAALIVLSLTGCAGYRLGPSNGMEAGDKSILVIPFENKTLEARLSDPVTQALRRILQQDGTFRLASGSKADYLVRGAVTKLNRSALSFQATDVLTARDYWLSITAEIEFVEAASGKVLWKGSVSGSAIIEVGPDLSSGERQAMPVMAESLARNALANIADGQWW